jgi:hypothetical protein
LPDPDPDDDGSCVDKERQKERGGFEEQRKKERKKERGGFEENIFVGKQKRFVKGNNKKIEKKKGSERHIEKRCQSERKEKIIWFKTVIKGSTVLHQREALTGTRVTAIR